MNSHAFSFVPATAIDAAELSGFAARTFAETFGKDNTVEDMQTYVRETFSPDLQAREIAEPGALLLLARRGDGGELAGYAHLMRNETERPATIAASDEVIELRRFYVGKAWHGSGLASALMTETLRHARMLGAQTLWLGVWEHNGRAIAFYRKQGFREIGTHPFQLGSDLQTDLLLAMSLGAISG